MMENFFVWCRDKGGSFVATSWLYLVLWGIVAAAFSTLLYMDGKFSRSLADGASINPLAFQVMGWCFRFFAVVFLMAAARNVHKGIGKGLTFYVLGVFVSIIVCAHAVGIGLEALDDKKDKAMAVQTTVTAQTDGIQAKLSAFERQKEGIRSDLAATKASNQAAIDNITSDGLNNDQLADVYRQDNADADKQARERIAAIDAAEIELLAQSATVNTDNASTVATADKWSPLFVGMAQLFTLDKEPSDWAIYLCGVGFIIFWVFVAESLVIFVPPAVYQMHLHDADNADKKDPKRVEAGKKAAETRKRGKTLQIDIKDKEKQQRDWWSVRLKDATHSAVSTEAVARYYFPEFTVEEFPGKIRAALKKGYATQEQYDDIMDPDRAKRRAAERKAAREARESENLPATTNGTGAPIDKDSDDDSSIEPSGISGN